MFAYMKKKSVSKTFFKSKEDVVSMFLGLVVVVALVGFLVNFIEKRKGNIEIPGVSNDLNINEVADGKGNNVDSIVVSDNDSLWKIAVKVYGDGYKWTEIANANNLKNPGLIYSGQKLIIPEIKPSEEVISSGTDMAVVTEKTEYTVIRNDSLWKIAVKVYGDGYKWTKIWEDNRSVLNSPDKLEIGMKLVVYGKI